MLTGRESLIRLVGKRRRFLPNRHSIVSAPIQNALDIREDRSAINASTKCVKGLLENDIGDSRVVEEDVKGLRDASASDWVKCPVCGNTVRGEDCLINTHLDACLIRGTKRKSTQRTLVQLSYWSRSTKIHIDQSDNSHIGEVQRGSGHTLMQNTIQELPEESNSNLCRSPVKPEVMQFHVVGSIENPSVDDKNEHEVDTPSLPCKIEKLKSDKAVIVDDISGAILKTFIVGRQFSDEEKINPGTCISFLRDPDNVKDPNAIKVISEDSGSGKVLGFLPRKLAQYLSPLIEKLCLSLEGHVISVPCHSHDVVPIQVLCQKSISVRETECGNLQVCESLWKNVLHVVESAATYSPNSSKYQQNFAVLVQEVLRSSPHLFIKDEKLFLDSFASLSDDCQRLFIRLYTRKGPWFRMSNIFYPEVANIQEAIRKLSATGYIYSFNFANELNDGDMKEILNLLTKPELREVSSMLNKKYNHGRKKLETIESLLSSYRHGCCPVLPNIIKNKTGPCIKISATAESLIWRTERLFFLNGEQDLSAFLLVDLGIVKYPTYNCIVSDQIFSIQSDLLAYEEALEVAQIIDESLDENDEQLVLRCIRIADSRISCAPAEATKSLYSDAAATCLSCFSASWIYSKVVQLGVSFLERERRYSDAIDLLKGLLTAFTSDGRRGYWTLRLSVNLEHIGRLEESLSVAEDGLLEPWVRAGSRIALQKRVLRLGKPPRRWKIPSYSESMKKKITEIHVRGRPLNSEIGMKSRFYGEDGEQCGVEQLALQYYAGEGGGWQGVHTESGIWLTLFGLVMWDAVFADVPNVFRTKFQTAPLDLETDSFYLARKGLIESHLQKIHGGMAEEILIMSWESHVGTACKGVNWERHSLSVLRAAVTCVGGPCLASICRHLAQDYRSWSSGMPDLLLWRFHGDYSGEAKLVEVKGPRDRLSEQQRAWLLLLMDCGFNVEVCKVSPEPVSV